jgi:hypothetical protein
MKMIEILDSGNKIVLTGDDADEWVWVTSCIANRVLVNWDGTPYLGRPKKVGTVKLDNDGKIEKDPTPDPLPAEYEKALDFVQEYFQKRVEAWLKPDVIKMMNKNTKEIRKHEKEYNKLLNPKSKWHPASEKPEEGEMLLLTVPGMDHDKRIVITGYYRSDYFYTFSNVKLNCVISWRYLPKADKKNYGEAK